MKKYLASILVSLSIVMGGVFVLAPASSVAAINVFEKGCQGTQGTAAGEICGSAGGGQGSGDEFMPMMKNIINAMIFVIGIIAVIMIVVGGVRYVVSNGESAQVKAAKDTVTYAVIGLVVAILAFAIVNFVIDQFR